MDASAPELMPDFVLDAETGATAHKRLIGGRLRKRFDEKISARYPLT